MNKEEGIVKNGRMDNAADTIIAERMTQIEDYPNESQAEEKPKPRFRSLRAFAWVSIVVMLLMVIIFVGAEIMLAGQWLSAVEVDKAASSDIQAPNRDSVFVATLMLSGFFVITMLLMAGCGIGILRRKKLASVIGKVLLIVYAVLGSFFSLLATFLLTFGKNGSDTDTGFTLLWMGTFYLAYCLWGLIELFSRRSRTYFQ